MTIGETQMMNEKQEDSFHGLNWPVRDYLKLIMLFSKEISDNSLITVFEAFLIAEVLQSHFTVLSADIHMYIQSFYVYLFMYRFYHMYIFNGNIFFLSKTSRGNDENTVATTSK